MNIFYKKIIFFSNFYPSIQIQDLHTDLRHTSSICFWPRCILSLYYILRSTFIKMLFILSVHHCLFVRPFNIFQFSFPTCTQSLIIDLLKIWYDQNILIIRYTSMMDNWVLISLWHLFVCYLAKHSSKILPPIYKHFFNIIFFLMTFVFYIILLRTSYMSQTFSNDFSLT